AARDRASHRDPEHGGLRDTEPAVRDDRGGTGRREVVATFDFDADHAGEQGGDEVDEVRVETERVDGKVAVDAAAQRVAERHDAADVVDVEPIPIADRRDAVHVHAHATD